jgi:pentafunctional AROM polypeptide
VLEPGEGSKQRAVKAKVEDWMIENRCLRDSCIIALGGGVVGDLAGFIAATYMRGIPFVQIPTSFLAMVDSSIGGKTGIDSPNGKNLIGAIWQPKVVLIDPEFLATLPDRHLCNGIAEAIKAGAICDSSLFELLELYATDILTKDIDLLCKVIQKSVAIKADVVRKDERENGMRAILNFGHSIGHAIEALLGLEVLGDGELLHGEAISIGMVLEATLARTMGYLHTSSIRRLVNCLQCDLIFCLF